jgi:hypothetical protein
MLRFWKDYLKVMSSLSNIKIREIKMSWIKRIGLLLVVVVLLAACGSNAGSLTSAADQGQVADSQASSGGSGDNNQQEQSRPELRSDFADNALTPALQLVVGSMKLDQTDFALQPDLASSLIPYWKLYKNLLDSDTTAPEELDALLEDIQGLMTSEQIDYIATLKLTQEDLMTMVNDLGIFEDLRQGFSQQGGGEGFNPPQGGMPEGFRPGDGPGAGQGQGGGPGAEGMDPELMATMQARREEMGSSGSAGIGFSRFTTALIDSLISQLEDISAN